MIELEGLTKDFGSLRAVDGINLQIPRGEFFAVLGPNAAGKTTTIKMMVGFIRPTAGRARIDPQIAPAQQRLQRAPHRQHAHVAVSDAGAVHLHLQLRLVEIEVAVEIDEGGTLARLLHHCGDGRIPWIHGEVP